MSDLRHSMILFIMIVQSLLGLAIQCGFLIRFTGQPFRKQSVLIYLIVFAPSLFWDYSSLGIGSAWQSLPWQISGLISELVAIGMLTVYCKVVLKQTAARAVTASLFISLSGILTNQFLMLLFYSFSSLLPGVADYFSVFESFLGLLFIFFLFRYWVRHYSFQKLSTEQSGVRLIVMLPLLLVIFLLPLLMKNEVYLSQEGGGFYMRPVYSENGAIFDILQLTFTTGLAVVCIWGCLFSYRRILQYFESEEDRIRLEQQLEFQRNYTREAKSRYEATRAFRHDLKNHTLVLKRLLEQGADQEAIQYLSHFERVSERFSFPIQTGNAILDVLCGDKLESARQGKISFHCEIEVPPDLGVDDFDLCILFANALDNAVKACGFVPEHQRRIDVKAKVSGAFFLIDVVNSCMDSSIRQGGLGLSNIRATVEKYGGSMSIRQNPNAFTLTILIPCRGEKTVHGLEMAADGFPIDPAS